MKKLKIGIVGLNFGRHIVGEIATGTAGKWFELAAVCDMDAPKAQAMAQTHGVKAYTSLDELLADDDIRCVGLFTGPNGRAALLHRIIAAGRDVMTTKPFEIDPEAATAVLREAEALGRVIHLNSPSPLPSAELSLIEAWRQKHNLGRPVGCRAEVTVSYREKADGSWYDDPQRCPVPPIYRLGIYLINDLVRLFGPASAVQVLQSRLFTGRPTVDNGQLGVLFESGAIANIYATFCVNDRQYYCNALTLNYENGTVYRNVGPMPHVEGEKPVSRMAVVAGRDGTAIVERKSVRGGSGEYQWDVFHRAVRGKKIEGAIAPEQVAAGLRIIDAMKRAATSGRTEAV